MSAHREGTVVFWDFDGTIAERPGHWSSCMLDVLQPLFVDHGFTVETFEPYLRTGFPWQDTTIDRTHLTAPDAWWRELGAVMRSAYLAAGVPEGVVDEAVAGVRARFADPTTWRVSPGAIAALAALQRDGIVQAVLSNHVPELPAIVDALGLAPGMSVLDVGCGPGRHSLALARRGFEVVGVDHSAEFVRLARDAAAADGLFP